MATQPDGQTFTFSYDAADRLTETIFSDETTEFRGYTLLDLTSFTDRVGNTTGRKYDGFRDLYEIDEPLARTTTLTYELDGTVHTITDPLGHVTTYARDGEGRVQTVTYPDSSTQWYAYDTLGRVVSQSPNQSPNPAAPVQGALFYAYNIDDTVSQAFLDARAPTVFTYDPAYRRLTGWSRVLQGTWAQPTCTPGPNCTLLDEETYTYEPVGSDGANKVSQVLSSVTPQGMYTTVAPTSLDYTYVYDALDRPTYRYVEWGSSSIYVVAPDEFVYDNIGRLSQNINPLGTFTYAYGDATARVIGRTSAEGPQIAALYSRPAEGDGLLRELTYTTPSGGALAQYEYTYDDRHNVLNFYDSNAGTSSYTYDAYSQLSTATLPPIPGLTGNPTATVIPDSAGNVASLQTVTPIPGPPNGIHYDATTLLSLTPDIANKLTQETTTKTSPLVGTSSAVQAISCDGSVGSLDSIGAGTTGQLQYQYDATNRLHAYTTENQSPANYSVFMYDGLGRLSQVEDYLSPTETNQVVANHSYAWCGQNMCMEIDNTQQVKSAYNSTLTEGVPDALYLAQGTVSNPETTAPQNSYDVTDLLGSERAVVTNNAIAAEYTYSPFGTRTTVTGSSSASSRGFTGLYYHAASGLQFAQNRAYNASLGRWMTRDPIGNGFAFDDPARFSATDLNLYAYAGNNPQTLVDPSGNSPLGAAIGATIGGVYGLEYGIGTGFVVGIPTGPGEMAMVPAGAIAGLGAGTTFGALAGGWIGDILDNWLGAIIGTQDVRPPTTGNPGDTVVGSKQSRRYGPDGLPQTDVDTGHDHGQGDPHVHDWGRNPDGTCDGQRGPGRAPQPGDPPSPPGYGNPNPFMTPTP
jgi:RHS repeat-associated protein